MIFNFWVILIFIESDYYYESKGSGNNAEGHVMLCDVEKKCKHFGVDSNVDKAPVAEPP
jgi:hypothetical protein